MRTIRNQRILIGAALLAALSATTVRSQQSRWALPSDEHLALANAADAAAAAGRFDEAVQQWQAVLDLPEDAIDAARMPPDARELLPWRQPADVGPQPRRTPPPANNVPAIEPALMPADSSLSLKMRVQRRLLTAPPAALEAYEQRFGAQARALLNDALRDHDRRRLSEAVRRFFGAQAGHSAAIVLAQQLVDDGEALAAARLYDRLAEHPLTNSEHRPDWLVRAAACWQLAGFSQAARSRLALRDSPAEAAAGTADDDWPQDVGAWFAAHAEQTDATPAAALSETRTFRGNVQRNASFSPAAPVGDLLWEYPTVDEQDFLDAEQVEVVRNRLDRLRTQYEEENSTHVLVPAGVPVTAGGLAVFRGPGTIKAVSLATGELAWPGFLVDDTFHFLLYQEWARRDEDWYSVNLDLMLTQRMYRDATFSSLSTDGRHVYALADGGMISSVSQSAAALPALLDHQVAPHSYNRLLVFELGGGRIVREYGGPVTGAPLSGAYFLGAPLPVDDELYCLIETQGQVQLAVIDQQRLDLQWTQALYNPIRNFSDPLGGMARRLAGIVPAVSGDIVVCPTGEATVIAVDRRRRTIEWTYEYQQPAIESPRQAMAIRMMIARQQSHGRLEDQLTAELLSADHWQDAAPIIDGQFVLLTPPDSGELLCVRLIDGVEVWRRPRGERQWIACVFQGNVILAGREQVEAIRLADGEPAWQSPIAIPRPGGRGFRHGRIYLLPLSTGEAVSIDLTAGRVIARTDLPEQARYANLVAADGRVVCQTPDSVAAFQTIEELSASADERIAARSDDAAALLQRGELRLHLGNEDAALADLRRAVAADPDSPARQRLVATLIEGLRTDFDGYRSTAAEIEQLVTNIADQALFHRLFAAGLQQRGEIDTAFQQYLRFADKIAGVPGLQKIDGLRQVRSDLWIAGRLQELLDAADESARQRLQGELQDAVETALDQKDSARLGSLRYAVDDGPTLRRIDAYDIANDALTAQQSEALLLQMLHADEPGLRAVATAQLADRWLAAGRTSDLLQQLLAELAGPLSSVDCLDGRTGAMLLEEWRAIPDRAALIDAPEPWPTVEVIAEDRARGVPAHSFPVQQMGAASELLSGWTFFTDAQGANLYAFDQFGQQAWQAPTGVSVLSRGGTVPGYVRYVATYGRSVLLVAMDQWSLFDAFSGESTPRLLANQRLATGDEPAHVLPGTMRLNRRQRNRNSARADHTGVAALGNVGPIVNGVFVYQRGNRLAAVNAVTGEELWTHVRPDLPSGGDITADSQTVVVWPDRSRELHLFRAVDGAVIGKLALPADVLLPQPEGYWGTRLVTVTRGADATHFEFGLVDPVRQSHVWRRSLPGLVDWGVVEGSDFYFLQADGTLSVVNAEDGTDRMRIAIPDGAGTESATVWSDSDRWYVATFRTANDDATLIASSLPEMVDVHGVVLAVSKQTAELAWSVPVVHQQLHDHLPGEWPFLMLSSARFDAKSETPQRAWTLLLLDKSTGRTLVEKTDAGRTEQHGWLSDPLRHRIHLATGTINLTLEFHDPEAEPPVEKPPE